MSILVDTNLVILAMMEGTAEHRRTKDWLTDRLGDEDQFVGLCWPVLYAVTRIISNRRIMGDRAVPVAQAWAGCDDLRRQRRVRMVSEGIDHHVMAKELSATPGLTHDDVPDVHLAALAIEHGLVLCTHDHGFARFAGLRWTDPLTGRGS